MITSSQVLDALRGVREPELKRDLVSLDMIRDIVIDGSTVSFEVVLTTPACPLRAEIQRQAQEAVVHIPGVDRVEVRMSATVPRGIAMTSDRSLIPTVRHAIAVASGKGGVGKSTVSVNLAVALVEAGADVGLLDGDIYGPNIPMMMGVKQALERSEDGRIKPPISFGVRLVSVGFIAGESDAIIYRGPLVGKMIQRFLGGVDWGALDYLIIDLPPGTGDASLTLAQSASLTGVVVVTTPQEVALADVRKCITMFHKLQVPILGIVENMSYFLCPRCGERADIFSHGGGRAASEELGLPFLGEIPLDPRVRVGGDEGRPIVAATPDSALAAAFRHIASQVAARISVVTLTGPALVQIEVPKHE